MSTAIHSRIILNIEKPSWILICLGTQSITTTCLSIGEQQHSNQSITTAWLSIGEQQHSDQSVTTAWLSIGEQQHSDQSITTAC